MELKTAELILSLVLTIIWCANLWKFKFKGKALVTVNFMCFYIAVFESLAFALVLLDYVKK